MAVTDCLLNWAITLLDAYRPLATLRWMAPENSSQADITAARLLAMGRCRGNPRQAMSAAARRRCLGRW